MKKLSCVAALIIACAAQAADWPQYRGPVHDGSSPEKITPWPKDGPKVLWQTKLGESFGSWAVAANRAYIMYEKAGKEVCAAFDADKGGSPLWETALGDTILERQGGNGPRTTPTIALCA